jgi:hypothetical protein
MPPVSVIAQNVLAAAALFVGVGLATIGMQRATRIDDLNAQPPLEWVTKANEVESLRASAVGRYVTGNEPGDRGIEIQSEGRLRFFRIVEKGERSEPVVKFRIGRNNGRLNLATPHQGTVEVINIDTLSYYRDVYRRMR